MAQLSRDDGHARSEDFPPGEIKTSSVEATARATAAARMAPCQYYGDEQLHTAQIPSLVSSCMPSSVATPRWPEQGEAALDKSPRCLTDLEQMLGEIEGYDCAAHAEILRASAAMRSAIEAERRFRYLGRGCHVSRRAQRTRQSACFGMVATFMVVGLPVLFTTAVLLGTPSLLVRP